MADIIEGPVIRVIDGDTFEMQVTREESNEYDYNQYERIRIADIDAPELGTRQGRIARDRLQNALQGKMVRCTVQTRDVYGRIVASVEVLRHREIGFTPLSLK